jgi:hypothetical protein
MTSTDCAFAGRPVAEREEALLSARLRRESPARVEQIGM